MKRQVQYWLAIGERYGRKECLRGTSARQALAGKLGINAKSLQKMYVDRADGTASHVGYIGGGDWWRLYVVTPWEGKV